MLNILDVIQRLLDFIGYIFSAVGSVISDFFHSWEIIGERFADLNGILPDFMSPFWLVIFGFCVFALIVKLVPFIG